MSGVRTDIVGRDREIAILEKALEGAVSGKGSTIFISGEAGIGKTRLIDEFKIYVGQKDILVLEGAATSDRFIPFRVISKALEDHMDTPLFSEHEHVSFINIFAINRAGLLLAQALPDESEDIDADIFAGMLTAVQGFVKDSFEGKEGDGSTLGRLEYGDLKILMENGDHLSLTGVLKGEHPDMQTFLKRTVLDLEKG